jgi:hypothetical protein
MIGVRDARVKEGYWLLGRLNRGGAVNRRYSNQDVRKGSFKEAADIIDAVTEGNFDRDSIRSPQITQKVIKHIVGTKAGFGST